MAISADELESIRADAERWLPDTCTITTRTTTYDAVRKPTTTTTTTEVPCRVAVLTGNELRRAAQVAAEASVVVTLPANTSLQGNKRISVTKAETGEVFEVEILHVNRRSQEITRRVLAKDLTP